jgi:hypothetical protein
LDVKKKLSRLSLFNNPQTLDEDQINTYKLVTLLMLGEQIPEMEPYAYPEIGRDEKIRQMLLWGGRAVGVASLYGFTMAWHYTLETAGISGGLNWILSSALSMSRIGNGNILGQMFVNIYDRFTVFRYPNQRRMEATPDQFVNQRGRLRTTLSLLNGGFFPMVILNQALRGSGFDWRANPSDATVVFDPNNVSFARAFVPLVPMLMSMVGPGAWNLSMYYGRLINMIQRLSCFRGTRKDGLHRTTLVGVLINVRRMLIYAPDEVVTGLYKLRQNFSGIGAA